MILSGSLASQTSEIELKARCNVSTVDFLGKVWFYKHYNADFFKDASNTSSLIGPQLVKKYSNESTTTTSSDATTAEGNAIQVSDKIIVQCDYMKNNGIETWISEYQHFVDFAQELNDVDQYTYKQSKKQVYLTSLSKGKWFKTNPKIWETNQSYYQIDDETRTIKSIVPNTDPIITGKTGPRTKSVISNTCDASKNASKQSQQPQPHPQQPQDTSELDQHVKEVMCLHDNRKYKNFLSKDEQYQFSEILQEDNCCIPFVMVTASDKNASIILEVQELMIKELHSQFNVKVENTDVGVIKIPATSQLLEDPTQQAYMLYYLGDLKAGIRFKTLGDQRRWWKSIQDKITTNIKFNKFKYFKKKGNVYQQYHHINFDIYKDGLSVPILMSNTYSDGEDNCKFPVSPSTCYNNNIPGIPDCLTFEKNIVYQETLPSFTTSQLENVLKITFPGIDTKTFRQETENSITFRRKECLMGIIHGLEDHECNQEESTIVFNTAFDKSNRKYNNVICELMYQCQCYKSNGIGDCIAQITSNTNKRKTKKTDFTFDPVSLSEKVEFPEDMNFEATVKNTDIGSAKVFEALYKNRFVYNPEDSHFYYYDGNVWQKDDKEIFTDTIIATKLASCMDDHIREFEDELDREEARQRPNKALIAQLKKKIKNCDEQRKRLTTGNSRVKKFIKTHITDKHFAAKKEHPGKIAALNGVVDLKTLIIEPFKPSDYITEKSKYPYYKCTCKPGECLKRDDNGNIQCNSLIAKQMQKVDDVIREIMGCDCENDDGSLKYSDDLYYHYMWCIGYGLSGEGNKKYLMYCHSPANSGKSLLLEAITEIFPQYYGVVPKGALFGNKSANGPTPELVLILDKRAGFCDEVGKKDHFDDRNTKGLTGRSKMEWRPMGGEYRTSKFKITPYIAANQYNDIDCLDPAFWDRLMPILFPMHFAREGISRNNKKGNERLRDETIVDLFETEPYRLGYSNWLIRACAYFHSDKNKPIPKAIREKISELKKESFALDEFVLNSSCYEFSENDKVELKPFYDEFKKYAQDNGIKSKSGYSLPQFRKMIKEMEKESSGYDRKISIDDAKGKTIQSHIKGIKKIDLDVKIHTEYSRSPLPLGKRQREFYDPNIDGEGEKGGGNGGNCESEDESDVIDLDDDLHSRPSSAKKSKK